MGIEKIYLDTNQLYYIRKIAEEAQEWDYGSYEWAYRMFPDNRDLVQDIRALCYIVALQYEWEIDFSSSNASFTEVSLSNNERALATQDAWKLFAEGLDNNQNLKHVDFSPNQEVDGYLKLEFIRDKADRVIIRNFVTDGADVLLTSDNHILKHKQRLADLNILVMRPSEWLNAFLENIKGDDDAVNWLEKILFKINK